MHPRPCLSAVIRAPPARTGRTRAPSSCAGPGSTSCGQWEFEHSTTRDAGPRRRPDVRASRSPARSPSRSRPSRPPRASARPATTPSLWYRRRVDRGGRRGERPRRGSTAARCTSAPSTTAPTSGSTASASRRTRAATRRSPPTSRPRAGRPGRRLRRRRPRRGRPARRRASRAASRTGEPTPHVIWYDRTSGIWQPVWLEAVPRAARHAPVLAARRRRAPR